jgi:hypothetical protein
LSDVAKGKSQVNVRLSDEAKALLSKLQRLYADRSGLPEPVSQAEALEIALRETARREKIKGGK